ncbi:protein phosphatase 2C domain-containing protein [Actinocorallia populi]|uniref:protein phosphatase 2C domain-containing protein n=1 Tax=Actinocorallia populi TaxID=2079200 RepID=UPI001E323AAE|nr:protein phosphatase 2C domain-containing protein [Actinocorallia populi]
MAVGTEPGEPDRENEDFAAVLPGAVVVIDGASAPAGWESGCSHSVAWYARTLGGLLAGAVTDRSSTLAEALESAIERVVLAHGDTCDVGSPHSPSATVAVARATGDRLEYLVLADAMVLLGRASGEPLAVIDDRLEVLRRRIDTGEEIAPIGSDVRSFASLSRVEKFAAYRNRTEGFWVASTQPAAAREAVTGALPLADVVSVSAMTDGATRLVDLFGLCTWAGALDVLTREGPAGLIRRTREAEATDPDGKRWPRPKRRDDATAVHWTLQD